MKKMPAFIAFLLLTSQYQAFSMNGFAISVAKGRGASSLSGNNTEVPYVGPMVKYTIANDAVARCDTVYKEHWTSWPVLNVLGSKIVFERYDTRGGADTIWENQYYKYLAVMDSDGKNCYDLDTMRRQFHRCLIAWPAGDYIFYIKNLFWWYGPGEYESKGAPTSEIWRVKYNDPSTRTKIFTYKSAHTFSLSLDGTRAGVCSLYDNMFRNIPHAFPPTSEPVQTGWDPLVWVGCGSYISPSGKYHHHFWDTDHTNLRINTWDLPKVLLATVNFNLTNDFAVWSGMPIDSIAGGAMEWGRWACNSDKWITMGAQNKITSQQPAAWDHSFTSTNQLLINWIDHKTINTSRNSKPAADGFVYKSDPGALWVAGGPGGETYEDVTGTWRKPNGDAVEVRHGPSRIDHSRTSLSQKVNVYTVQGKLLGSWDHGIISRALPTGTYVVAPASAVRSGTARISIGGNEVRQ